MKNLLIKSILFILCFKSIALQADTTIPVVLHYNQASDLDWSKNAAHPIQIPKKLIERVKIKNPTLAFKAPYTNVFFQNERVAVCHVSCSSKQGVNPLSSGLDYRFKSDPLKEKAKWELLLKLATVYYWINQFFDRLEQLEFTPNRKLIVIVDSEQEEQLDEMLNATFNPINWTIRFPRVDQKVVARFEDLHRNSSALDPSVIIHETAHSVMDSFIADLSLFRNERKGIEEAVADYLAASLLESPVIGVIMQQGEVARDLSKAVSYEAGLEEHKLGHVIGSILWSSREMIQNSLLSDRVVLEAAKDLGKTQLVAQAGQFRDAYFRAFDQVAPHVFEYAPWLQQSLNELWDLANVEAKAELDLSPLSGPIDYSKMIELQITQGETILGFSFKNPMRLALIEKRKNPNNPDTSWHYVTVTIGKDNVPLWILYSHSASSVLAVYGSDRKPVHANFLKLKGDDFDKFFEGDHSTALNSLGILYLRRALPVAVSWLSDFSKRYRNYFFDFDEMEPVESQGTPEERFLRGRRFTYKDRKVQFQLNDERYNGAAFSVNLKYSVKEKMATWSVSKSFRVDFRPHQISEIEFYTIGSDLLDIQGLVELFPGQTVVGYNVKRRDGTSEKILITRTGRNFQGRPLN